MAFLVTCEHGSHRIPDWLSEAFGDGFQDTPEASESCDWGAIDAATHFARVLHCPLIAAPFHPLVVDVNRAANRANAFSSLTKNLPQATRQRILAEVHQPYCHEVETAVAKLIRKDDFVIHLSVHSFAPFEPSHANTEGQDRSQMARRTDLGLLYDPTRDYELALCMDWYDDLYFALPMLRVRRNYPRRGVAESLIRTLRTKYSPDAYIGIELQLNQAWCVRDVPVRKKVFSGIAKSLLRLCDLAKEEHEAA